MSNFGLQGFPGARSISGLGSAIAAASGQLTVTSVPLGGYADVFTTGDAYKAVGISIQRSLYPDMSFAFPRNSAYTAISRAGGLPTALTLGASAYGNGMFVTASGQGGQNVAASSPDGVTWTKRVIPGNIDWKAMAFGNGVFVAVGSSGSSPTTIAASSIDGITWTQRVIPNAFWIGVTYSAALGLFVAVSGSGNASTIAATSPDGITWTQRVLPSQTWCGIASSPTILVATAGANTPTTAYATSTDGITWTQRVMPSGSWFGITYGAGLFVATSQQGIATSPDGINWTSRVVPASVLSGNSIAYGNGMFLIVGGGLAANVLTSPDGITWTLRASPNGSPSASAQISFGLGCFFVPIYVLGSDFLTVYVENNTDSDWMYIGGTAGKYVRVK